MRQPGRTALPARAEGILTAADALDTRTSLLGPEGQLLIQSDGESPANRDDLIDQHLLAGTYLLQVEGHVVARGHVLEGLGLFVPVDEFSN